jgi:hypothetical protein
MKRRALPFAALYLAVALVSFPPSATASTHLDTRLRRSSITVPSDNFFRKASPPYRPARCSWALDLPDAYSATGFDLRAGCALRASYEVPDRGVCADIALAQGDVYITDTTDPTAATRLPGRILRLTTPDPCRPTEAN